jgi:hypothetical protein
MGTNRLNRTGATRRSYLGALVAAALAAAAITAAPSTARAENASSCKALEVSEGAPGVFQPQPSVCAADQRLYGRSTLPAGSKLLVNGQPAKLEECPADSADKGRQDCFWLDPKTLGAELQIAAKTSDDVDMHYDNPNGEAVWKKATAKLVQEKKPEEGDVDKDKKTGKPEAVWEAAFTDGIRAVGLDNEKTRKGCEIPAFESWWRSPKHIQCRRADRYILFFSEDGTPIEPVPQVDENDKVVLIVVASDASKVIEELRVSVCDGAAPLRIGGSARRGDGGVNVAGLDADGEKGYALRVATRCSGDAGIKAILRLKGETRSETLDVPTLPLHQLTVGLGLIYDFSKTTEYRAAFVKGENTPVIVEDTHLRAISPPVPFITYRPVAVDVKRSRLSYPSEWFGVSVGLSLVEPLDHLYVGLLVEPFPGFGVIGGAHFQTVASLAGGYAPGDRFTGSEVPVDKRWSGGATSGFVGFNVEASVLARLLDAIQ